VNEDTTSAGVQVSSILTTGGWADVDTGAVKGLAVTATTGNGTWQYSTDNSTWTAFGSVAGSTALLLDSGSYIRYVPDGQNGETATFTYRAWDKTSGTASSNGSRSTGDASSHGANTPYSDNTGTGSITVTSVNDAPTLGSGTTHSFTSINEDTTGAGELVSSVLTSGGWADVDSGAVKGIAVTATTGNGVWQYSTDNATWTAFGSTSGSAALLLDSGSYIRFVPDGLNGETATFTYRAWDKTSGTASSNGTPRTGDTSANGGTTAYSSNTGTGSVLVTPVNDAPTITAGGSLTYTENGAAAAIDTTIKIGRAHV
jgi:hypothetical protein